MAGVLNFTLGLATSQFVRGLSVAGAALGGLTAVTAGFAGVFRQIGEGDRLGELGKRVAADVGQLFQLEAGFEEVGVSAQNVGMVIERVQKSLGGFNEMGEPTKDVFAAIGLSVEELKRLDAPTQIQRIATALAAMPKEEAMNIAAKIAGRGGAGDLLQIGRSAEDFAGALKSAAEQAAIMQRNAPAFSQIDSAMKQLARNRSGFFLGLAEGAAPGIQAVLDKLNKADLTGLGVQLGKVLSGFSQAFAEGRFGELLALSIRAGLEQGFAYFGVFLGSMSSAIVNWNVVELIGDMFAKAFNGLALGLNELLAATIGRLSPDLNNFFQQRRTEMLEIDEAAGQNALDAFGKVSETFAAELAKLGEVGQGEAFKDFRKALADFNSRLKPVVDGNNAAGQPAAVLGAGATAAAVATGQASQLERFGILNFGRSGLDSAQQTARNTSKMLDYMRHISTRLDQAPLGSRPDYTNVA